MGTLLIRLAAPLQAWGSDSKFDTRTTEREPTKSGVIGLLSAALGIRRDDTEGLTRLTALKFGIRIDREGVLLRDFHTARSEKSAYITYRHYLCDAVFLCGLESENDALLTELAQALQEPVFPLFLGRRSCPPTLPMVIGIRNTELETALRSEPRLVPSDSPLRILLDMEKSKDEGAIMKDVPVSFSPMRREFTFRKVRETFLPGTKQTEHDPFAELEA